MDRTTLVVVASATILGLFLRVINLTDTSFTNDEAYSVWAVRDLSRYLGVLPTDNHPPLWYGWLAVWIAVFGDSDLSARLSSAIAVILLVPLTALAAARLFDNGAARWAAVLTAIWPMTVIAQRDVRMYAWLPVLAVTAILLVVRAVEARRGTAWALSGAPVAALAATHHMGTVVGSGLLAGSLVSGRSWRGTAIAAAVAAALYLPFAILFALLIRAHPTGLSRGIGPGSVMQLITGISVGDFKTADPALLLGAAVLIVAAVAIGLARSARWREALVVALVTGTVVPMALSAFVFYFPPAPRYFIGVVPVLVLATARFAATARAPAARAHAIVTTVVLACGVVWGLTVETSQAADWRGLAALVERDRGDATAVYVAPWYYMVTFDRYTHGVIAVRPVPDVPLVPPGVPLPTAAAMRDVIDRAGGARWVLVPDWLLYDEPEIAALLAARGSEVPTGWWMRAYRLPPR